MELLEKFPHLRKQIPDYYLIAFKDKVAVFDKADRESKVCAMALEILFALSGSPGKSVLVVTPKVYRNELIEGFRKLGVYNTELGNGKRINVASIEFSDTGKTELGKKIGKEYSLVILDRIRWVRRNGFEDLDALKEIRGDRVLVILEKEFMYEMERNITPVEQDYNCVSIPLCIAGYEKDKILSVIPWYEYKLIDSKLLNIKTWLEDKYNEENAKALKEIEVEYGDVDSYLKDLNGQKERLKLIFSRFVYSLGREYFGGSDDEEVRKNIENCNRIMNDPVKKRRDRPDDIDAEKAIAAMNEWRRF